MPLTKLQTGLISDDAVTSAKIADSTIIAEKYNINNKKYFLKIL